MRQDHWVERTLRRYSTTIYACHFCGATRITDVFFAAHLVRDHAVRDPTLLRFLSADSDVGNDEWLNEACRRAKAMPGLS